MKIKLPYRKKAPALKRPPRLKLKASVARSRRAPVIEEDEDFYDEPEPNMKLSHAFVVVLVLHVIAVAGVFAFNTIKARQDQASAFTAAAQDSAIASDTVASTADAPETTNATAPKPLTATPGLPAQPIAVNPAPAVAPKAAAPAAAPGATTHEVLAGETLTRISAQYGVSIADIEAANGIDDPTKIRAGTVLTIPQANNAPKPQVTEATVRPQIEKPAEKPATAASSDSGEVYEVVKGDNPVNIAKRFGVSYDALMKLNDISDPRLLQIGQKLKIPAKD